MTHASSDGLGNATFCLTDTYALHVPNDTDGDGCSDCDDENPNSAFRAVARQRGRCCDELDILYVYQGVDTDGDGLLDCADPDDDGDGIPDAEDPCPIASCVGTDHCVCGPGDWIVCGPLQCGPFFLDFYSEVSNPAETRISCGSY